MEPTTIDLSDVTIERSHYGRDLIRISQDHDLIVVEDEDIEEFVAAVRKHANIIEEAEPSPHITAGGEDLRMTLMIARANLLVKKQDVAYEEGRIAVLDSILGD